MTQSAEAARRDAEATAREAAAAQHTAEADLAAAHQCVTDLTAQVATATDNTQAPRADLAALRTDREQDRDDLNRARTQITKLQAALKVVTGEEALRSFPWGHGDP